MANRTLIKGGIVITVDPQLGDLFPAGDVLIEDGAFVYDGHPGLVDTILVDGRVVKRNGELLGVDEARVRRLATESRDDILRRAEGRNGARIGGDWIPEAYQAVDAG